MTRPELFFWFNSPPKVERGAYSHVAAVWGNTVHYVITQPLRQERINLGWDDGDYGDAKITTLPPSTDPAEFVAGILRESADAVHVFSGFSGTVGDYLTRVAGAPNRPKIAVVTERPGTYGPFVKKMLRLFGMGIKQRLIRRRISGAVDVLLPLGHAGVETFGSYGWPASKMFPFMYCPDVMTAPPTPTASTTAHPAVTRFLYVGRFSRFTKGTNTLLAACDRLNPESWHLGLVGGYGDHQSVTRAWIARHKNAELFENYSSAQVSKLMGEYDVCVVPSHFDGWNVVINEAFSRGLPVIATNQAISDEIVTKSGAGLVVRSHSARALAEALTYASEHPSDVAKWRARAEAFFPRISPPCVGDYLVSVLDHALLDVPSPRPTPPWH